MRAPKIIIRLFFIDSDLYRLPWKSYMNCLLEGTTVGSTLIREIQLGCVFTVITLEIRIQEPSLSVASRGHFQLRSDLHADGFLL